MHISFHLFALEKCSGQLGDLTLNRIKKLFFLPFFATQKLQSSGLPTRDANELRLPALVQVHFFSLS